MRHCGLDEQRSAGLRAHWNQKIECRVSIIRILQTLALACARTEAQAQLTHDNSVLELSLTAGPLESEN